jgi:hypothetical protein
LKNATQRPDAFGHPVTTKKEYLRRVSSVEVFSVQFCGKDSMENISAVFPRERSS